MSSKLNSHSKHLNAEIKLSRGKKIHKEITNLKNQQLTQQAKPIPFSFCFRVWEEDCEYTGIEHNFWG